MFFEAFWSFLGRIAAQNVWHEQDCGTAKHILANGLTQLVWLENLNLADTIRNETNWAEGLENTSHRSSPGQRQLMQGAAVHSERWGQSLKQS